MEETAVSTAAAPLCKPFDERLRETSLFPLTSEGITVFQVNMGRLCNLSCRHCHIEAGPGRIEVMPGHIIGACLEAVRKNRFPTIDITGGAPEMNPGYRGFVRGCAEAGSKVMTRTNLAILLEPGFEDLPEFLAGLGVEVVASLPYYMKDTVERQRGGGVFATSVEALRRLNAAGYGTPGGPVLDLVYNPCGAYLPPDQKAVEADFRRELGRRHGISFTSLFTLTNMPLGRFLKFLEGSNNKTRYMARLQEAYNPMAAANVMCRHTLSVGWDGSLYDCDFNQALGLKCGFGAPSGIEELDLARLEKRRIVTGPHCYGCTAGAGSSCTGAVS